MRYVGMVMVAVLLTVVLIGPAFAGEPQTGLYSSAGGMGVLIPFQVGQVLMAAHDCLYYGAFGCTPSTGYVAYVDNLNNAWRTQKHYDKFGVEYTPKESKGYETKAQADYYTYR